jgi:hypothetical protein
MSKTSIPPNGGVSEFQVEWVFGSISETLRRQLVMFWLKEGALTNADEAWRRSFEVACVLREGNAEGIAGICTVAIHMDDHGRSYGFVRIFIRRDSRFVGLNVRLMERMIEGFTALAHEPGAPHRLLATIENRKIERRAAQRILAKLGFNNVGTAANGELIIERHLAT